MKLAVFLERDGILNLPRVDRHQQIPPLTCNDVVLNEEAIEPLRELKAAGFLLIVITNQPGLSRGYQSRRELDSMHQLLKQRFALDDILTCPHDEADHCPCRKPKAGLLFEATFKWHLDLDHSFVVSDKWQDAQAAHLAGCTSILVKSQWNGGGHHDFILSSLSELAAKIRQIQTPGCLVMNHL